MSFSEIVDTVAYYIWPVFVLLWLYGLVAGSNTEIEDYKARDDEESKAWRRKKFEREHLRVNHNNEINTDDLPRPLDAEDED